MRMSTHRDGATELKFFSVIVSGCYGSESAHRRIYTQCRLRISEKRPQVSIECAGSRGLRTCELSFLFVRPKQLRLHEHEVEDDTTVVQISSGNADR